MGSCSDLSVPCVLCSIRLAWGVCVTTERDCQRRHIYSTLLSVFVGDRLFDAGGFVLYVSSASQLLEYTGVLPRS